jgi:hypothetical protein
MSVLLILFGFLASLFGGEVPELAPAPRLESFVLFERGRVWQAERRELGSAVLGSWSAGGEVTLEFLLELEPIKTRVQRVLRRRPGESTYSWREWRSSGGPGAQAGRTLVLERSARGSQLREWAGRAMRAEVAPGGIGTLELVEDARRRSGFGARIVQYFDPLEVSSAPALVLDVPLAWGLAGCPRMMSLVPLDSGKRPSHWVFSSRELIAFAEGELVGSRCVQPPVATVAVDASAPVGL